ncbi:phosphoribosylamine--glycine ligase [Corynebacterium frankenforstense]|uniref:phosphoribosylamine--glycine ligase n=1 Tax=Corynebacterium frankenforstense TaxID=1230998 RepID=UPI0026EACA9F|nr:phosphoribosylamine--glycine ligase [Corynebacterium frankenforstense]
MKILVIGAGAREHALLKGLSADPVRPELHVAPGNAGMAGLATIHDVPVTDAGGLVTLARSVAADLVVIGPEAPLVAGVADELRAEGFAVFGPSAKAARLEGSKAFAKDVMAAAGVRTARARQLAPGAEAEVDSALDEFGPTWVVKDDGLAGGKGVVVTPDRAVARAHAEEVLAAGNPVLFESFLTGPEVSLFCLVDGETVVPLLPAQDHKRAYDDDKGPNTGGMGAYCPLPWLPSDGVERIVDEVCRPVAAEMVRRGEPYSGLLYAGLAWGPEGPAVVEFNARFGDPETQAVLSLLKTPLAGLLDAVARGTLAEHPALEWEDGAAVTVVLAAEGYPAGPRKGDAISGLPEDTEDAYVLHAGTAAAGSGSGVGSAAPEFVSAGGRVLSVVGKGADLAEARERAYALLEGIELKGSFYRHDIGAAALEGRISL